MKKTKKKRLHLKTLFSVLCAVITMFGFHSIRGIEIDYIKEYGRVVDYEPIDPLSGYVLREQKIQTYEVNNQKYHIKSGDIKKIDYLDTTAKVTTKNDETIYVNTGDIKQIPASIIIKEQTPVTYKEYESLKSKQSMPIGLYIGTLLLTLTALYGVYYFTLER